jgi:hypothetical protein
MNSKYVANCGAIVWAALLVAVLAAFRPQAAQSDDKSQSQTQQSQQSQGQIQQPKAQSNTLHEATEHAASETTAEAQLEQTQEPAAQTKPAAEGSIASPEQQPGGEAKPAQEPQTPEQNPSTPPTENKPYLDIYGFAQLDIGFDFRTTDPNWFDVNRPSKLPSFRGEFGRSGNTFVSVRQSRFGVKGFTPTDWGELKAQFEFDLFGVGADAGQTTIRPRHMWGELGFIGAGQTNSVFMDIDVFPNILDYWGPNGMVFFRNPQLRWMPIHKDNTHLWIALERPGASGDGGTVTDRIQEQGIRARFPYPDLTAQFRYGGKIGYIQAAGIARDIRLDDPTPAPNLSQGITGWGVDVSSNVKFHKDKDILRLQYVIGDGIENYMNDAPFDVAARTNFGDLRRPIRGRALPMRSLVAYLDHSWSDKWTTSLGYSQLAVRNTDLQAANAFHRGQYATINLLHSPFKNFMLGGELQWARRKNFRDGFGFNDYRIQFSFKYSFDAIIGGKS